MGSDSGAAQQTPDNTERARKTALIARVDAVHESPEVRARKVLELLKTSPAIDTWDVTCFCAEYLGMMGVVWPWMLDPARRLAALVYTAHYEHFGVVLPEEAKQPLA